MYFKNRYFSQDLGRFISRDPLEYITGQGLYEYASSRPTSVTDPMGLLNCCAKFKYTNPDGGSFETRAECMNSWTSSHSAEAYLFSGACALLGTMLGARIPGPPLQQVGTAGAGGLGLGYACMQLYGWIHCSSYCDQPVQSIVKVCMRKIGGCIPRTSKNPGMLPWDPATWGHRWETWICEECPPGSSPY
jgi:hypothetical protein